MFSDHIQNEVYDVSAITRAFRLMDILTHQSFQRKPLSAPVIIATKNESGAFSITRLHTILEPLAVGQLINVHDIGQFKHICHDVFQAVSLESVIKRAPGSPVLMMVPNVGSLETGPQNNGEMIVSLSRGFAYKHPTKPEPDAPITPFTAQSRRRLSAV